MTFLAELETLTSRPIALNNRIRDQHAKRGLPNTAPLVALDTDEEIVALTADWTALVDDERSFYNRFHPVARA